MSCSASMAGCSVAVHVRAEILGALVPGDESDYFSHEKVATNARNTVADRRRAQQPCRPSRRPRIPVFKSRNTARKIEKNLGRSAAGGR